MLDMKPANYALLFYCLSSILMTVTNKVVLSQYDFQLNFLLLAIQSIVCVFMLQASSYFGLLTYQPIYLPTVKIWFHVSIALVLMIYTGSKALQFLSIPLVTIFKNITIIIIAFSERFIYKGSAVTPLVLGSFLLMVVSSVIAGYSDISQGKYLKDSASSVSIIVPYFWMFANCFSSAFYVLTMRACIKQVGFKDFDTVYYNNVISIPILILMSVFVEFNNYFEFYDKFFVNDEYSGQIWGLCTAIIISSISTFAISYATSWSMRVSTSTTYSMVGALNKLPIAIAGMMFFSDPVTLGNICGVLLAFAAGLLYSYAKSLPVNTLPVYTTVNEMEDLKDDGKSG